jgi:hypothetical protein
MTGLSAVLACRRWSAASSTLVRRKFIDEQKTAVLRQLDEMVSERSSGSAAATLTAPLNTGLGIK